MHIHLRFPIQSLWIKSADALAVPEQHRRSSRNLPCPFTTEPFGALLDPAREPVEVPSHLFALEHRLVEDMSAARVDVELDGLPERLQGAIKLPGAGNRHPRIPLAMLNQQRRRHALDEI